MPQVRRPGTYMARPSEVKVNARWHVVDASEQPLGRMAVQIARVLQGKHRATYTPHLLTGDFVVVVNAAKVKVTGSKMQSKLYQHHTGYPGGIRTVPMERVMQRDATRVVYTAVRGMLPHTTLGDRMLKRLHVYAGPDHPHQAQVNAGAGKAKASEEAKPE